jgi:PilZ domain
MDSQRIEGERRQHSRFELSGMLLFQMAVPADDQPPPSHEGIIQRGERRSARIKNIGGKGCCLSVDRPLRQFQIIKMDFPLLRARVSVPTLAEIRWVHDDSVLNQYLVGLRYLL